MPSKKFRPHPLSDQARKHVAEICGKNFTTHGATASHAPWHQKKNYRAWRSMIQRCEDKNCKKFKSYGAKGIKVCRSWRRDFVSFSNHMGVAPSAVHQVDRINPLGNYEPGNCRWATPKEQQRNRTNNVWLEHRGLSLTLPEWAEKMGVKPYVIRLRLKRGWSVSQTLSTPLIKSHGPNRTFHFDAER
jgi:hypothetical protein